MARRAGLLSRLGVLRTQTATGLAHTDDEAGLSHEAGEDIAASRRGRAATSRGRAVHAVLQVIDLATGAGLDDLARAQAAAEGIPEQAAGGGAPGQGGGATASRCAAPRPCGTGGRCQ